MRRLADNVWDSLQRHETSRQGSHAYWTYYFGLGERPGDRLRRRLHFLRLAITPLPVDRKRFPLPPSLAFLHYLIRPLRIAGRYGTRPARLVRLLRDILFFR